MPEPVTTTAMTRTTAAFDRACARLQSLQPEHPRVYAVAAMAGQGKRRWWHVPNGLSEGRVELMYRRHAAEMINDDIAAEVVATALIHAVVGRVTALFVLDAQAWDPGRDNLWIHHDNDGGIDWAGLSDTTIRVVDGDPDAAEPGTLALPCEAAMAVWLAQRCASALIPLQSVLTRCSGLPARRFWSLVGESVIGAATYVPDLARVDGAAGARRGQLLLGALTDRGLPVRRTGCLQR
ncbi:hypothetical protein NN3_55340 [Nocardia neocaledoniensis NBRC 108232]|uniref:Ferric iron reductase FhuF-like transporter n=1 Tax=Nocardia neocaledoniensis TaxID=236511 RepID=A0A317NZL8_9NOCA|nr:hypothetical protein [Nocardia neocaledoniensis]PWV80769.1 hypothetical protein DFR69_101105 [Nocardia neocaledoniensis]GEM34527.1 hypothetical protein NN3_55340 [Nocardia neocaledoniensis NBRC 108232]